MEDVYFVRLSWLMLAAGAIPTIIAGVIGWIIGYSMGYRNRHLDQDDDGFDA